MMGKELEEQVLGKVSGGYLPDPISGYDYQDLVDLEARICGDWVYEEFEKSGAVGLKKRMREEFGDLWFVKKFPIFDENGNIIG